MSTAIAVIGGGASGVLFALHLLDKAEEPLEIVLVEPGERLGAGIAYATTEAVHLLNTRTSEMSLFSDRPEEFTSFAARHGLASNGEAFAPRRLFGKYLLEGFAAVLRSCTRHRFETVHAEAVDIEREPGAARVVLSNGTTRRADHVVLCVGPPPTVAPWRRLHPVGPGEKLVELPFSPGALEAIGTSEPVLLLGSGLTMVDVVLSLRARHHEGALVARSRHGLLPLAQHEAQEAPIGAELELDTTTATGLCRAIRLATSKADADNLDWRAVIAGIRPVLPAIWQDLALVERQRLLRHAHRYWEIHRHRMAPSVAATIAELQGNGALEVAPGRLIGLEAEGGGFLATLVGRDGSTEQLKAQAVINCTGPASSYAVDTGLVGRLLSKGLARIDPSGLGLHVDADGDLIDASGTAQGRLHSIGWVRRGRLYESSAIPELRAEAEALARRLGRAAR